MIERDIFLEIIKTAEEHEDPEGSVAACLVKDGDIIAIAPSAEDGIRHAEDLVIELALKNGTEITEDMTILTTLEPCSYRSHRNEVKDCASIIIDSGIRNVVYAADDPNFSSDTKERFERAGVKMTQTDDKDIINRSVAVFNGSIKHPKTIFGTDRSL